jgi:choline dehydrogenase
MGREGDPAALDPRLRVRGVAGLRVADASSWPCVTSGNTNAPAMMTGHKAGELILQDHGLGLGAAAAVEAPRSAPSKL